MKIFGNPPDLFRPRFAPWRIREQFTNGVGGYTFTGNAGIFTASESTLTIAKNTLAATSSMSKAISGDLICSNFEIDFMVSASFSDDSPSIGFVSSGVTFTGILGYRESALDALRRPIAYLNNVALTLGTGPITLGTWYRCVIKQRAGANQSTAQIYNLSTGALFTSGTFAPAISPQIIRSIGISQDANVNTCPGQARNLYAW